ncbi:hypothetical protein HDN1F_01460 [gamma proteobacterium HdN1]|nr:hypothetical protein HDN1F_01460 [gamma proteobacterium HdN1]
MPPVMARTDSHSLAPTIAMAHAYKNNDYIQGKPSHDHPYSVKDACTQTIFRQSASRRAGSSHV